ncbi:MAG TPA: class I SAM-dependent methyltransferase [Pseudolabrys sp.]|nr:class I SAM-dependent methyltransferase [Pseudolabrys sp.]
MNQQFRIRPLDSWVAAILADPVTKLPARPAEFRTSDGAIDARVFLRHSPGFIAWQRGQSFYEQWQKRNADDYRREIEGTRPVYEAISVAGRVLDVGGGAGTLRHFLPPGAEYISIDPFADCLQHVTPAMRDAYACLSEPLNFISACAEFLPFQPASFDCVHMRSVIDHFQSPDLALFEARRVLKPNGKLIIGLWVDGGKSGKRPLKVALKEFARPMLVAAGFHRFKDHHIFHPTFSELKQLVADCGFRVAEVYWQPQWDGQVCYLAAEPR